MYAIYGKSRSILALVLTLGLVNPVVNIVSTLPLFITGREFHNRLLQYYNTTLSFQAMPPPFRGCGQQSSLNSSTADLVLYVST